MHNDTSIAEFHSTYSRVSQNAKRISSFPNKTSDMRIALFALFFAFFFESNHAQLIPALKLQIDRAQSVLFKKRPDKAALCVQLDRADFVRHGLKADDGFCLVSGMWDYFDFVDAHDEYAAAKCKRYKWIRLEGQAELPSVCVVNHYLGRVKVQAAWKLPGRFIDPPEFTAKGGQAYLKPVCDSMGAIYTELPFPSCHVNKAYDFNVYVLGDDEFRTVDGLNTGEDFIQPNESEQDKFKNNCQQLGGTLVHMKNQEWACVTAPGIGTIDGIVKESLCEDVGGEFLVEQSVVRTPLCVGPKLRLLYLRRDEFPAEWTSEKIQGAVAAFDNLCRDFDPESHTFSPSQAHLDTNKDWSFDFPFPRFCSVRKEMAEVDVIHMKSLGGKWTLEAPAISSACTYFEGQMIGDMVCFKTGPSGFILNITREECAGKFGGVEISAAQPSPAQPAIAVCVTRGEPLVLPFEDDIGARTSCVGAGGVVSTQMPPRCIGLQAHTLVDSEGRPVEVFSFEGPHTPTNTLVSPSDIFPFNEKHSGSRLFKIGLVGQVVDLKPWCDQVPAAVFIPSRSDQKSGECWAPGPFDSFPLDVNSDSKALEKCEKMGGSIVHVAEVFVQQKKKGEMPVPPQCVLDHHVQILFIDYPCKCGSVKERYAKEFLLPLCDARNGVFVFNQFCYTNLHGQSEALYVLPNHDGELSDLDLSPFAWPVSFSAGCKSLGGELGNEGMTCLMPPGINKANSKLARTFPDICAKLRGGLLVPADSKLATCIAPAASNVECVSSKDLDTIEGSRSDAFAQFDAFCRLIDPSMEAFFEGKESDRCCVMTNGADFHELDSDQWTGEIGEVDAISFKTMCQSFGGLALTPTVCFAPGTNYQRLLSGEKYVDMPAEPCKALGGVPLQSAIGLVCIVRGSSHDVTLPNSFAFAVDACARANGIVFQVSPDTTECVVMEHDGLINNQGMLLKFAAGPAGVDEGGGTGGIVTALLIVLLLLAMSCGGFVVWRKVKNCRSTAAAGPSHFQQML